MIPVFEPDIGDEEAAAVLAALKRGEISGSFGTAIPDFERTFADYVGCKHGVAVSSGTTALQLAVAAAGIGPGDEVLVSANTNIATALAVTHNGALPVPVDSEPTTWNLDLDQIERLITPRTRAIIPVHIYGHPVDMDRLRTIVEPRGLLVIEDCAESHGATVRGRMTGSFGQMGCFSFYANKIITTGEGGMVTTDDAELAARAARMRNHGAGISEEERHSGPAPYLLPAFADLGFNYRMTDVQAAIGLVQLGHLDEFIDERDRWARWYSDRLGDIEWLRLPEMPADGRHGWQSYVAVVTDEAPRPRNELMQELHAQGVSTRPGTHCVPALDLYRERGSDPSAFPVAQRLEQQTIAIPLHNQMSEADYEYVADALHQL
jgi:perosamine synthetase